jgi:hypothetical protein
MGSWVVPRTGVDDVERTKSLPLPDLEFRPLGRPARSQSLYRLRYPGSLLIQVVLISGSPGSHLREKRRRSPSQCVRARARACSQTLQLARVYHQMDQNGLRLLVQSARPHHLVTSEGCEWGPAPFSPLKEWLYIIELRDAGRGGNRKQRFVPFVVTYRTKTIPASTEKLLGFDETRCLSR